MKEYKVYLNDLVYITSTDANNKFKEGMIKSNIIFYNKTKYEDLYKIRSEISWYLVNQKCLDKINNLQSKINKINQYIKEAEESDSFTELPSGKITDVGYCLDALEDIKDIIKEADGVNE